MLGRHLHYTRRTMLLLIGLCMLPLVLLLFSAALAGLLGCELNEAGVQPCEVFGLDLGGFLSSLFSSGWLALISIPLLTAIFAVWALFEGGSIWRQRRKDRKDAPQDEIET